MNNLPISISIINSMDKSLLLHYKHWVGAATTTITQDLKYNSFTITSPPISYAEVKDYISYDTFKRYNWTCCGVFEGETFIPVNILNTIINSILEDFSYREGNRVFKIFLYLYNGCIKHAGFRCGLKNIAAELHIKYENAAAAVDYCVEKEWFAITKNSGVSSEKAYAREFKLHRKLIGNSLDGCDWIWNHIAQGDNSKGAATNDMMSQSIIIVDEVSGEDVAQFDDFLLLYHWIQHGAIPIDDYFISNVKKAISNGTPFLNYKWRRGFSNAVKVNSPDEHTELIHADYERIPILEIDHGILYPDAQAAAVGTGCRKGWIIRVCRGLAKQTHGYRFKFYVG